MLQSLCTPIVRADHAAFGFFSRQVQRAAMGRRGSRAVDIVWITELISSILESGGVAHDVDRFVTRRPKIVPIDLVQSSPQLRLRFDFDVSHQICFCGCPV
jgi:hypothetical protein